MSIIFKKTLPSSKVLELSENKINLKPYLTLSDMTELISNYIRFYFLPDKNNLVVPITKYDKLGADYALILNVIGLCTDIDLVDFDLNSFLINDYWDKLKSEIVNYYDFEIKLFDVIDDIKEEIALSRSLGSVLDNLLTRLSERLGEQKDMNIDEIKEGLRELLEQIEGSPLKALMAEKAIAPTKKKITKRK